jgi:DNA-binding response OmpR family regulator
MDKILIVEDNQNVASTLERYLSKSGYRAYSRVDGLKAQAFISENAIAIDLIILDIKLPGMNGLELCRHVRKTKIQIPILMLTNVGDVDVIVRALELGADDYLTKPFALPELLARVKALLRRPAYFEARILKAGELEVNLDTRTAKFKRKELGLRRKEFDLLHYLIKNRNQMLSREQILMNVWNLQTNPYPNSVDVHIKQLRNKILKISPSSKSIIQTIYGFGYKLNATTSRTYA